MFTGIPRTKRNIKIILALVDYGCIINYVIYVDYPTGRYPGMKGPTVSKSNRQSLTPEQVASREARKAKFKALWKQVANMPELERITLSNRLGIVTVEGRALSMNNQCLLAIQCPGVSVVGGFRQWLAQGRCVMKGQHGHMLWVPSGRKSTIEPTAAGAAIVADGETNGDNDTRFIIGTVFDISQTAEIEQPAMIAA